MPLVNGPKKDPDWYVRLSSLTQARTSQPGKADVLNFWTVPYDSPDNFLFSVCLRICLSHPRIAVVSSRA